MTPLAGDEKLEDHRRFPETERVVDGSNVAETVITCFVIFGQHMETFAPVIALLSEK